jgi:hypothetical protein
MSGAAANWKYPITAKNIESIHERASVWNTPFTLFIGYIFAGAFAHPSEFYFAEWAAVFCMDVRIIAGVLGTCALLINRSREYHYDNLCSQPWGNNETSTIFHKDVYRAQSVGIRYSLRYKKVTDAVRKVYFGCLVVMLIGAVLEFISMLINNGVSTIRIAVSGSICGLVIVIFIVTYFQMDAYAAQNRLIHEHKYLGQKSSNAVNAWLAKKEIEVAQSSMI